MIHRILITFALLIACIFAASTVPVSAYDTFQGVDCSGAGQGNTNSSANSAICNSKANGDNNPLTGKDGLLINIGSIISYVAGAGAIIVILIGSLRYITSGGDPAAAKTARDAVLYALIGLVVIILARTIIYFIVSKLK
jgi:hypothetical protein